MHIRLLKIFTAGFCLSVLCTSGALAQIKFTATVSPASIGKNETAELRLMVENARQVDQIIPPLMNDFDVVGGPNQESGYQNNNGVTKQFIGITFIIRPKTAGQFTLAPATANADGKTLKSNAVKILVTNNTVVKKPAAANPFAGLSPFEEQYAAASYNDNIIRKGENVQDKIAKNIFIKVETNKSSCYVGEPVVVTYKLFTRLKSESNLTKNPSFNGFSVIDLLQPGSNTYSVEKENGREYNVYTLRMSQLYPLQPGQVELGSAEVENNIQFIKSEYARQQQAIDEDPFGDFAQQAIPAEGIQIENVLLKSKPGMLLVKALPEQNKPENFKGAVGNFTMMASVERNTFTTDDAGKLIITVAGEGNLTLINTPEIVWPNKIEGFDSKVTEELNKTNVPVSGFKSFEFPFTVTEAGNYEIAPVLFSFFNPKEGKYISISTKAIGLTVTKGSGKPAFVADINAKSSFLDKLFANRLLIAGPVALLIITGLIYWLRKEMKTEAAVRAKQNVEELIEQPVPVNIPVNYLAKSEVKLVEGNAAAFYETLNSEVQFYLAKKFNIPVTEVNKKTVAEEADKQHVSVTESLQLQQLMDDIQLQLYTPLKEAGKMLDMFERASKLMHSTA